MSEAIPVKGGVMSAPEVQTPHGPGTLVAIDDRCGRTMCQVEGPGFSVWLHAAQVPEFGQIQWDQLPDKVDQSNTTVLPYNPTPQNIVSDGTSTIRPGEQTVDGDARTTPSESLSGADAALPAVSPNPDLFSRVDEYDIFPTAAAGEVREDSDQVDPSDAYIEPVDDYVDDTGGQIEPVDDPYLDDPELYAYRDPDIREQAKFAAVPTEAPDPESLEFRLAHDPMAVLEQYQHAAIQANELDSSIEAALDVLALDENHRTAAWADVRKKAVRLRRSGQVDVVAANPSAIVATVTGDHGIYDTVVLRGSIMTGDSSVSAWSCSCPWGAHAFHRETFFGRLCSHGYATLLELRAMNQRKEKPHNWSDKVSARETEADRAPRPDGRLDMTRGTLVPSYNFIDKPDAVFRTTVTAAIESIRPSVASGDASLLDKLKALVAEGGRPQKQREYSKEIASVVDELTRRGYAVSPLAVAMKEAGLSIDAYVTEPFVGSGPKQWESIGTSEQYVQENELDNRESVTESSGYPSQDTLLASFQKNAGWLRSGEPEGNNDDIAGAAQAFLKTAGRQYTPEEQRALVDEEAEDEYNLANLDLSNTHYLM